MKSLEIPRAIGAALITVAISGTPNVAAADIKDYEFQLVDQTVQTGSDKVITVRLMNKKTGKPVPDAVIFATRLDMTPDAMQEMATKVTPNMATPMSAAAMARDVSNDFMISIPRLHLVCRLRSTRHRATLRPHG